MELQWRNVEHIQLPNIEDYLEFNRINEKQTISEFPIYEYSDQIYKKNSPGKIRKPRRQRTAFTCSQRKELEKEFKKTKYVTDAQSHEISTRLQVSNMQVRNWFKNKRRKCVVQEQKQILNCSINTSDCSSNSSNQSLDANLLSSLPEYVNYRQSDSRLNSVFLEDFYDHMDPRQYHEKNVISYTMM